MSLNLTLEIGLTTQPPAPRPGKVAQLGSSRPQQHMGVVQIKEEGDQSPTGEPAPLLGTQNPLLPRLPHCSRWMAVGRIRVEQMKTRALEFHFNPPPTPGQKQKEDTKSD